MSDTPIVEFADVCFSYEREEVLHNVSLKVPKRALVACVGPNGGGKTTLLRLTLGLLAPQRGSVRVFGASPTGVRSRVGYVPQSVRFDADFPVTVEDVVLMGRVEQHAVGPYSRMDRDMARQALAWVGLERLASRPYASVSGGERQRILIGQALATDPELLLMDEPTANVDAVVQHSIYELLKELNARLTIVVVSHNLNVVTRHATHVICVNRTAVLRPMNELDAHCLQEAYGGDMTVLQHEATCHILDPSEIMEKPHRAETSGEA